MFVKNVGKDPVILTEYNGKRFCFPRGVIVEISAEIYNNIILSGFINAQDVRPIDTPTAAVKEEKPAIVKMTEKAKEIIKPKKKSKK